MRPPIEFDSKLETPPLTTKTGRWTARHVIKRIVQATFVLLVVTYVFLVYRYYKHGVQVKRNYVAELNEPVLKIPEEKRAWTHYRRALVLLEPMPSVVDGMNNIAISPDDLNWPVVVEYLKRNRKGIDALRHATTILPLGILYGDQHDPLDVPWLIRHEIIDESDAETLPPRSDNPALVTLTHEPTLRGVRLMMLLAADATLAAIEQDSQRAVADLVAMLAMAEQWRGQPILIDQMIATSMLYTAVRQCGVILADHPDLLSHEQLRRLASQFDRLPREAARRRFDGERLSFADIMQRSYTDDGNGDGLMSQAGVTEMNRLMNGIEPDNNPLVYAFAPVVMHFVAGRRESMEKFERYTKLLEEEAAVPLWQRPNHVNSNAEAEFEQLGTRYFFLKRIGIVLASVNQTSEELIQQCDAVAAAIALVRYHRRHQVWPMTLEQLQPEFLATLPVDRLNGNALRYGLIDGRPVLYSVGANLKDDGGVPFDFETGNLLPTEWRADPWVTGDWILWPPVKESKKPSDGDSQSEDDDFPWPRPPEPEMDEAD